MLISSSRLIKEHMCVFVLESNLIVLVLVNRCLLLWVFQLLDVSLRIWNVNPNSHSSVAVELSSWSVDFQKKFLSVVLRPNFQIIKLNKLIFFSLNLEKKKVLFCGQFKNFENRTQAQSNECVKWKKSTTKMFLSAGQLGPKTLFLVVLGSLFCNVIFAKEKVSDCGIEF